MACAAAQHEFGLLACAHEFEREGRCTELCVTGAQKGVASARARFADRRAGFWVLCVRSANGLHVARHARRVCVVLLVRGAELAAQRQHVGDAHVVTTDTERHGATAAERRVLYRRVRIRRCAIRPVHRVASHMACAAIDAEFALVCARARHLAQSVERGLRRMAWHAALGLGSLQQCLLEVRIRKRTSMCALLPFLLHRLVALRAGHAVVDAPMARRI